MVSPNSRTEIVNIEMCPLHLLVKWELVSQIVDIHVGNLNMKLTGMWFPQIVDRDSGNLYPIYIKHKLAGDLGRPSCLVFIAKVQMKDFFINCLR